MEPRAIVIGQGTMLVDSEDFINGYQAGHLACTSDVRHYEITNENVTAILMEKLEDVDSPVQYSIGYCIGWIATFALKGNPASVKEETGQ
jgi:hypothetical protein